MIVYCVEVPVKLYPGHYFLKQQQSVKNVGYALKNGRRSQKRH